jgi:hypothetical protein
MLGLPGRIPAARWLFSVLVVMLVLGHVCDLPASVVAASHHHSAAGETHDQSHEGPTGEQVSSCDAATAASNSSHFHVQNQGRTGIDVAAAVPVIDAPPPVTETLQAFKDPGKLRGRLPLFLLHASFLI